MSPGFPFVSISHLGFQSVLGPLNRREIPIDHHYMLWNSMNLQDSKWGQELVFYEGVSRNGGTGTQNGWLMMEHPVTRDDLEVRPLRKPACIKKTPNMYWYSLVDIANHKNITRSNAWQSAISYARYDGGTFARDDFPMWKSRKPWEMIGEWWF